MVVSDRRCGTGLLLQPLLVLTVERTRQQLAPPGTARWDSAPATPADSFMDFDRLGLCCPSPADDPYVPVDVGDPPKTHPSSLA